MPQVAGRAVLILIYDTCLVGQEQSLVCLDPADTRLALDKV